MGKFLRIKPSGICVGRGNSVVGIVALDYGVYIFGDQVGVEARYAALSVAGSWATLANICCELDV